MKITSLFLFMFVMAFNLLSAQIKTPIEWEKLSKYLPGDNTLPGFQRDELNGDPGSNPPMPNVSVTFIKKTGSIKGEDNSSYKEIKITIDIQDALLSPEFAEAMLVPGASSQRVAKIKNKYPGVSGKEKNDFGYESCMTIFVVNKRFIVSFIAEGTSDLKIIDKLIDSIPLDDLEKIK